VLKEGFMPGVLMLNLSQSFGYCLTINLEELKPTRVLVKEIKKNSPKVLKEKQINGSPVVSQECGDWKVFMSINVL
jgi:hypothetical protein